MQSLFEGGQDSALAIDALDRPGLSRAQLRTQCTRIGGELRTIGINPEDRVAIVLPNGPLMASAFVCCAPWCATAPLNPAYTHDEFTFYLDDLEAQLLLVQKGIDTPSRRRRTRTECRSP